jgi:methyl coenzyme M reductase alpha subunit
MIKVIKDGLERDIHKSKLQEYIAGGWKDASKKKKTEKSAETAPEAAQEDLGNDISKGE